MHSHTSSSPDRRARRISERRSRRRPAMIAAGLAFGLFAAAGMTVTATASEPEASGTSASFTAVSFPSRDQPIAPADAPADKIATDAQAALTDAEATITAAATVTADIQASGLDIGTPVTTIDTTALEAAVAKLEVADGLPAPLVPDLTNEVTMLVASVGGTAAGLRSSLDAAQAAKAAAEEAVAQAQREAEAAAAAKKTPTGTTPVYAAGGTSAAEAQAIARSMIAGYGWGDDQFSCLVSLWNRESGWNVYAANQSSGAYGIPQALPGSKMASAGADWQTSASTQISWGLGYITGRYGNACGAWSHSESHGWY